MFSLQRTNPRISGNIKLVIDQDGNPYLESISSSDRLNRSIYKGFKYNPQLTYYQNLRGFAKQFTEISPLYDVFDERNIQVNNNLATQHYRLYDYGAYSSNQRILSSKFRFFAPVYIQESSKRLPENFLIFKLPLNRTVNTKVFGNTYYDLIQEINQTGELIKQYDIKDLIGKIHQEHSDSFISLDFQENGFLLKGLNLKDGYVQEILEDDILPYLANERTFLELENQVTNIFFRNGFIHNNIINLEFLFDDQSSNGFNRYIGFYSDFHPVENFSGISNNKSIFLKTSLNGIEKSFDGEIYSDYEKYLTSQSIIPVSNLTKSPQFQFEINFLPKVNQRLRLIYNGIIEVDIRFTKNNITGKEKIRDFIIDEINRQSETASFISVTAYPIQDNQIIIRSDNSLLVYENIKAELPDTFIPVKPLYSQETYENTFYGAGNTSIISDTILPESVLPYSEYGKTLVKFIDRNSQLTESSIIRVIQYTNLDGTISYIYQTNRGFSSIKNTIYWYKLFTEEPGLLGFFPHKDFDTSIYENQNSPWSDVLDFDISLYRNYLLSKINDQSFLGRVEEIYGPGFTPENLQEYRNILISNIEKYFNNINFSDEFLIKRINLITQEVTTTNNEYQRLEEKTNPNLLNINRIIKKINKFRLQDGNDVSGNPYRFNINLPFKYDNFSPSTEISERNINYFTHSWFIIGDGAPPYLQLNQETVKKYLGYSSEPLTFSDLLSTSDDPYQHLEYQTNYQRYFAYSRIKYDQLDKIADTFFRGLKVIFDSSEYDGWKFSVILQGRETTENDNRTIRFVRNDIFQELTIFINFYIPDPILTRLEGNIDQYYLDRSLLYFSQEILSTDTSQIDFGNSEISLNLYNNTLPKRLYGQELPSSSWYYINSENQRFIWVGRGDQTVFREDFTGILELETDFTIFTTYDQLVGKVSEIDPTFGMEITFVNIKEIAQDFFWCQDIVIKYIKTSDPNNTPKDPNDNTVDQVVIQNVLDEYLSEDPTDNDTVFQTQQMLYISQFVAYQMSNYEKIVKAEQNVRRYGQISTSDIIQFINNNTLKGSRVSIDGSISEYYEDFLIVKPQNSEIIVSLDSENSEIFKLNNPYRYKITRYNGKYVPMFTDIFNPIPETEFKDFLSYTRYIKKVSRQQEFSQINYPYLDGLIQDVNKKDFYWIFPNQDTVVNLNWKALPIEYQSYLSILLNINNKITIQVNSNRINLIDDIFPEFMGYLDLQESDFTIQEKRYILGLTRNPKQESLDNYNLINEIVKRFLDETFFKIYQVELVLDEQNRKIGFQSDGKNLDIFSDEEYTSSFQVIFSRIGLEDG